MGPSRRWRSPRDSRRSHRQLAMPANSPGRLTRWKRSPKTPRSSPRSTSDGEIPDRGGGLLQSRADPAAVSRGAGGIRRCGARTARWKGLRPKYSAAAARMSAGGRWAAVGRIHRSRSRWPPILRERLGLRETTAPRRRATARHGRRSASSSFVRASAGWRVSISARPIARLSTRCTARPGAGRCGGLQQPAELTSRAAYGFRSSTPTSPFHLGWRGDHADRVWAPTGRSASHVVLSSPARCEQRALYHGARLP